MLVLLGVGVLVRVGVSDGVSDAPDDPWSDTLMTLAVRYDSFTARRWACNGIKPVVCRPSGVISG